MQCKPQRGRCRREHLVVSLWYPFRKAGGEVPGRKPDVRVLAQVPGDVFRRPDGLSLLYVFFHVDSLFPER